MAIAMPAEQAKNHWHGQPLPLAISPAPQLHAERLRRRQASLLRQRDELTAGHFLKRRPDHRQYQPGNLNSAGFPDVAIFLQNLPYKVVLKDASDVTVTTVDPYYVTDLKSVALTKVGSGSPSGVVAGTAGSTGVLPTSYWDFQNLVLYVCRTTGNAATAVWTATNASAATPTVVPPQGYLTLTSATPIITGDVSAATSVYYTPFVGNLVPIYNGSRHVPTEFTELTLDLVASHTASSIYDVFVFSNGGVLTSITGPASTTATAGAGARGSGAGTTQLTRVNGYLVNAVSMTGRNGSTTYSGIGANLATYVGSIFMDGSNGQVTCHRTYGQNRKWGVWNAYNRQPIMLKAGDYTASWAYNTATIRASNNSTSNGPTLFCGLAEELLDIEFVQSMLHGDSNRTSGVTDCGIGWNSTTAMSGRIGRVRSTIEDQETGGDGKAWFVQVPSLGINTVTALENTSDISASTSPTYYGTETNMLLTARWRR
jgi:hypothetical protein